MYFRSKLHAWDGLAGYNSAVNTGPKEKSKARRNTSDQKRDPMREREMNPQSARGHQVMLIKENS